MIRIPTTNITGEGFKGERVLAITAVALTILSTLMLIDLTIKQRNHLKLTTDKLKLETEKLEREKENQDK
jgi:hypothetical protein